MQKYIHTSWLVETGRQLWKRICSDGRCKHNSLVDTLAGLCLCMWLEKRSSQSYSSRSGVWKGLLNRSCYAGIAANKVPQLHVNVRPGANTYMTALSLMRLMRLHPVEPKDEEVMQLGVDASFSFYLMNGINQGRLRSQDYLTWVKAWVLPARCFGPWAHVPHVCAPHGCVSGLAAKQ